MSCRSSIVGLTASVALFAIALEVRGQAREYYLTTGTEVLVLHNGSVVRSWSTAASAAEYAIAILSTVRLLPQPLNWQGAEYSLLGVDLGTRYTHVSPLGNTTDGTTDGSSNYTVDWDGDVFRLTLDWANPQALFHLPGGSSDWIGMTYDVTNNSLWIGGLNANMVVQNRTMGGALLSSFGIPFDGKGCLALDPVDGTLWMRAGTDSLMSQYTKAGAVIQTLSFPAIAGKNALGGEFVLGAPPDCNSNGVDDPNDIAGGTSDDCNANSIPDECDIDAGTSDDCNSNTTADECETDCNGNATPDDCDIAGLTSGDCNSNDVPDDCDAPDCNGNGVPDGCDFVGGTSEDCDGGGVPDECEGPTGDIQWIGSNGASFSNSANWIPATVPSGGGIAVISNASGSDNRCILSQPGTTALCAVRVEATGSGRQILQVDAGSVLRANSGFNVSSGGHIDLQGGDLAGGTMTNAGNSISGYGMMATDVVNQGLIESRAGRDTTLVLAGDGFENQTAGTLRASIGSGLFVRSTNLIQNGRIEARANGTVSFNGEVVNAVGGTITLLGGVFGSDGLTNEIGGHIEGTGTIDTDLINNGDVVMIADMLIVGDLDNDGTITIQSGLLTVTGNVSGSGAIIGGIGP